MAAAGRRWLYLLAILMACGIEANSDLVVPLLTESRPVGSPSLVQHNVTGLDAHPMLPSEVISSISTAPSRPVTQCSRSARCEALPENATCFDTLLPYTTVSFAFTGLQHYWEVQSKLSEWASLRHVPKCWAVMQPLLCAIYLPKCHEDKIDLISRHLCKVSRGPCRVVESVHSAGWPHFLQCNNTQVFRNEVAMHVEVASRTGVTALEPDSCQSRDSDQSERRLLRFNTTSSCLSPHLVRTTVTSLFYDDIDECGLNCYSPQFTKDEHDSISGFIRWGASIGMVCSIFVFATTILIERSKKIRPSFTNQIVLCMSLCCIMIMLGFLLQFVSSSARRDIVCRDDGTRRMTEPDPSQSSSCSVVFFLIYFFSIAFGVWMVIFACSWSVSFSRLGKVKEDHLAKRQCSLHIAAWSIPFILTTVIFVMNVVEADSLVGICFVGHYFHSSTSSAYDPAVPVWFVVVPVLLVFVALALVCGKIFRDVHRASKNADTVLSEKAGSTLKVTLLRLAVVFVPTLISILYTFVHHLYIFSYNSIWAAHLKDYLVCLSLRTAADSYSNDSTSCQIKERPSLVRLKFQLFCGFMPPFLLLFLIWRRVTFHTWRRFILRYLCHKYRPETDEERRHGGHRRRTADNDGRHDGRPKHRIKAQKHQVIAQAYAKRHELRDTGRLSLTFHSTHENPVGLAMSQLNDSLDSGASNSFSSSWVAALPRFVERRGAMDGAVHLGLKRSDSIDSKLNFSGSVSIRSHGLSWMGGSRRHSTFDSQFSLHQSELDHLESLYRVARSSKSKMNKVKLFGSGKKRFLGGKLSRRGSLTSDNSSVSQVLPAVTLDPAKLEGDTTSARWLPDHQGPSSSTALNRVRMAGLSGDDDAGFQKLEEKLRHLTEASKTSMDSLCKEDGDGSSQLRNVGVQTSLTDAEWRQLVRIPETRCVATQYSPLLLSEVPSVTSTTTSSSQTERNLLLPLGQDAEQLLRRVQANVDDVVRIRVPHFLYKGNASSDERTGSSLPSSIDEAAMFSPPSATRSHHEVSHYANRGRRGAVAGDLPTGALFAVSAVMSDQPGQQQDQQGVGRGGTVVLRSPKAWEEIELKVRTPSGRNNADQEAASVSVSTSQS